MHRKYDDAWRQWVLGSGLQSARQCWDHVAFTLNRPPQITSSTRLRGKSFAAG